MLNEQTISNHITIGGRPEPSDFPALKEQGYSTVISLLTPEEDGFDDEKALAEAATLDFESVPVAPNLLDDITVARFIQEVASAPGKVYVHCQGGGRAGVMALLDQAIESGWTIETAIHEAEIRGVKLGPDSPYRQPVEDYLRRHSAGERLRVVGTE